MSTRRSTKRTEPDSTNLYDERTEQPAVKRTTYGTQMPNYEQPQSYGYRPQQSQSYGYRPQQQQPQQPQQPQPNYGFYQPPPYNPEPLSRESSMPAPPPPRPTPQEPNANAAMPALASAINTILGDITQPQEAVDQQVQRLLNELQQSLDNITTAAQKIRENKIKLQEDANAEMFAQEEKNEIDRQIKRFQADFNKLIDSEQVRNMTNQQRTQLFGGLRNITTTFFTKVQVNEELQRDAVLLNRFRDIWVMMIEVTSTYVSLVKNQGPIYAKKIAAILSAILMFIGILSPEQQQVLTSSSPALKALMDATLVSKPYVKDWLQSAATITMIYYFLKNVGVDVSEYVEALGNFAVNKTEQLGNSLATLLVNSIKAISSFVVFTTDEELARESSPVSSPLRQQPATKMRNALSALAAKSSNISKNISKNISNKLTSWVTSDYSNFAIDPSQSQSQQSQDLFPSPPAASLLEEETKSNASSDRTRLSNANTALTVHTVHTLLDNTESAPTSTVETIATIDPHQNLVDSDPIVEERMEIIRSPSASQQSQQSQRSPAQGSPLHIPYSNESQQSQQISEMGMYDDMDDIDWNYDDFVQEEHGGGLYKRKNKNIYKSRRHNKRHKLTKKFHNKKRHISKKRRIQKRKRYTNKNKRH